MTRNGRKMAKLKGCLFWTDSDYSTPGILPCRALGSYPWDPTPGILQLGSNPWNPTPGILQLGSNPWNPTPGILPLSDFWNTLIIQALTIWIDNIFQRKVNLLQKWFHPLFCQKPRRMRTKEVCKKMTLGITAQVYVVMQASQSTCTPIQTTNIQCTTNVTIAPLEMISSPILPKT